MATHCLFGIFVFGSKSDTIYRFVTDDLFAYLKKCFIDRGYSLNEDSTDTNEVRIFIIKLIVCLWSLG